jgi:hypothetical protein
MAKRVRKPLFLGVDFPFTKGPEGIPKTRTDAQIIQSDLSLLLNTKKRERVMLPEFGIDLERLVFENRGPLLRAKAFRAIADAIGNFEPRVALSNVQVEDSGSSVSITVEYFVQGFQNELTLDFNRE